MNQLSNPTTESGTEKSSVARHKCLSCGMEYDGNFCPNCGQSSHVGRLSFKRIFTEALPDVYNLDNKLVRTCIDLFRRPGNMIREYIQGNRSPYYKPLSLLFLVATAYIVVAHLCNIDTNHEMSDEWFKMTITDKDDPTQQQDINLLQEGSVLAYVIKFCWELWWNTAWHTLFSVTLMLIPLWLAFYRTELGKKLNLAEYFFIMVYVSCQSLIIEIIEMPIGKYVLLSENSIGNGLSEVSIISFIFWIWTFKQLFGISARRTFWCYVKTQFLFLVMFILLAVIVVLIMSAFGAFDNLYETVNSVNESNFRDAIQEIANSKSE